MNNSSLLRLQIRIQQAFQSFKDSERGQGSVEYAGIVFVVAALMIAVIGVMSGKGDGIADVIVEKVKSALESIKAAG